MAKDKYYGKTLRKNFARHEEVMAMPDLLEIQKKSYKWFLDTGLREVFADVASITDYAGNLELSFIDYSMDEKPKYDVEECKARDATYAAPLKVTVRLRNKETEEIKEQEIFMGDFPLMTHGGTFVINGAERVVVSQIVRSPGIYYGKEIDLKTDLPLLTSTVIPYRGAWLEYETDANEMFWVRIDKNRKIPITCLIRALGVASDGQIKELFGQEVIVPTTPFPVVKLADLYKGLEEEFGYTVDESEKGDLTTEAERLSYDWVKKHYGHEFLFITDYSAEKRAFYHMRDENGVPQGYDLIWRGVEITTGAQREHRYDVLKKQAEEKGLADDVKFYLEFFQYGCPPHGGFGLGIDRLTMLLCGQSIKDAEFLFRGPNRLTP